MHNPRRGATLIDLMIALGIMTMLFGGIYLVFFSVIDATVNVEARTAAAEALRQGVEMIRNMPYDKVGVTGAFPPGDIPSSRTINVGDYDFTMRAVIRNIDDPFDGTLGGNPNDTAPADYKLVELVVECAECQKFTPLSLTTTVSPKSLEASGPSGSLFINVFDASGNPIEGATVNVVNASTSPTINLTDTTNNSGVLQLVGVPTSSQSYRVSVSKDGYSSDKTYLMGAAANPNPLHPHATVALNQVTNISFAIDRMSTATLRTVDNYCAPISGMKFSVTGSKLIGTSPDTLKYSTSVTTDAQGKYSFPGGLEWDTYSLALTSAGRDISGSFPLVPLTVNPASTLDLQINTVPSSGNSLLVSAANASGTLLTGAYADLQKSGWESGAYLGEANISQTSWTGGGFASASGVDTDSIPGSVIIARNASGTFDTGIVHWMESNSFDLGTASATVAAVAWAANIPIASGADALRIQLAGSSDGSNWNYVGPDGTAGTYFTTSSVLGFSLGGRYVRYKVFLKTADINTTPELQDVTVSFSSPCIPAGQALFQNLSTGTYTLTVSAPGYQNVTTSVAIVSGWQRVDLVSIN